jgi:hypothetical protein
VQHLELELAVGETIQIGEQLITVIEVDDAEISVRIDPAEFSLCESAESVPRK